MTQDFRVPIDRTRNLSDADLAWAVIAPLWDAVDFGRGWPAVSAVLAQATVGQRELLALDWCQKEIRNGGLAQFFRNSSGMLAPEALAGFRRVGALSYAEILAQAISLLSPGEYPRVAAQRRRLLAVIPNRGSVFETLEDRFFVLLRDDDLERYRGRYVRQHPEEFFR